MYTSMTPAEFREMTRTVELTGWIMAELKAGKSADEIAADLNASGTRRPSWPRKRSRLRLTPRETEDGQTVYAIGAVR
ncbi:hypothetical protein [Streptomyces cacaoi]|uniref:Uncharacterized protein n=1 Tax=Streptomyces cacaoi TaxID=1898 RepID=A0A4Y3R9N6_STRCI|nr:hypothetical protein [Streptomyces cacaoi]NNG87592.1 hypothetical protein [Streptomyces cacaoi]GEB54109.1 hypothetical protein SCA03_66600 [Streptomyces cacaoi]